MPRPPRQGCEESSTPLLHWGLLLGKDGLETQGEGLGGLQRAVAAAGPGCSLADGGAKEEGTSPVRT